MPLSGVGYDSHDGLSLVSSWHLVLIPVGCHLIWPWSGRSSRIDVEWSRKHEGVYMPPGSLHGWKWNSHLACLLLRVAYVVEGVPATHLGGVALPLLRRHPWAYSLLGSRTTRLFDGLTGESRIINSLMQTRWGARWLPLVLKVRTSRPRRSGHDHLRLDLLWPFNRGLVSLCLCHRGGDGRLGES
jgi:hypothetical protein